MWLIAICTQLHYGVLPPQVTMASTTSRVERTRRNPEEVVANLVEGYVSNVCLHDACMYVTCTLHIMYMLVQ